MTTHTLPRTQTVVPAKLADITLRATSQYRTRNGVGFLIEITDANGNRLGDLENQGNGGGTWFCHDNVAAMHWWNSVAAEYADMPEALEQMNKTFAEFGLPPLEELGGGAHELLADNLAEEALQ